MDTTKVRNVKLVKLTKSSLSDYPELLSHCGAIYGDKAFPEHVFLSDVDLKELVKNILKKAKQEAPTLSGPKLSAAMGYHRLNLEPNKTLKHVIKPGYAIIDDLTLERDIQCLIQGPPTDTTNS